MLDKLRQRLADCLSEIEAKNLQHAHGLHGENSGEGIEHLFCLNCRSTAAEPSNFFTSFETSHQTSHLTPLC